MTAIRLPTFTAESTVGEGGWVGGLLGGKGHRKVEEEKAGRMSCSGGWVGGVLTGGGRDVEVPKHKSVPAV